MRFPVLFPPSSRSSRRTQSRLCYTLCALSFTVIAPLSVRASPPPKKSTAAAKPAQDLPNFAQVNSGLYRGAAPTAAGLAKLKAMGVKTIIDLRIEKKGQEEEAKETQALGLTRIRIPLGREAPTSKQVKLFLDTLNDPQKQPVYVHCQHGADRTGAMIGIWREVHDGWDFPKTWAEMRHYGFKPYLSELKGAVESRAPKK